MADSPTPTFVLLIPPPLPPSPSSSLDLSPVQYVLGLVALVSIPTIIYLFLFAIRRTSNHPSFAETRTTRTSPSSSFSSVGSQNKSDFIVGGKIVSDDTKCYEEGKHEKASDQECVVCLSGFDGREAAKQLSVCKHAFHASCINTWLDSNGNTCPICRASIGHKKRAAEDPPPDASDMV